MSKKHKGNIGLIRETKQSTRLVCSAIIKELTDYLI